MLYTLLLLCLANAWAMNYTQPLFPKTFTVDKRPNYWVVHLKSEEYDHFDHIPGVIWNGSWLESLPMVTSFDVPADAGPRALHELRRLGYGEPDYCGMCIPNVGCFKPGSYQGLRPRPDCIPSLEVSERLCRVHWLEWVRDFHPQIWQTLDLDLQLQASSLECQRGSPLVKATQIVYTEYIQAARLRAMIDDFDKKFKDDLLKLD